MIPQQYIFAGERAPLKRNMDIFRQPDYGRRMNGQLRRVQHMAIVLFNSRDAFENHYHCAPLVAHINGLKRSIQH
jgi:hypothetical protein